MPSVWRTFGGRQYKAKHWYKTKTEGKKYQRRYGGRLVPTPKSFPEYAEGYKWTLYVPK